MSMLGFAHSAWGGVSRRTEQNRRKNKTFTHCKRRWSSSTNSSRHPATSTVSIAPAGVRDWEKCALLRT
jgi:hypothetical protein